MCVCVCIYIYICIYIYTLWILIYFAESTFSPRRWERKRKRSLLVSSWFLFFFLFSFFSRSRCVFHFHSSSRTLSFACRILSIFHTPTREKSLLSPRENQIFICICICIHIIYKYIWGETYIWVYRMWNAIMKYHLLFYELRDRVHESFDSIFSIDHRSVSLKNVIILAFSFSFSFFFFLNTFLATRSIFDTTIELWPLRIKFH